MKDKLNQFVDNTIGHFQEVSSREALYQCMDLVYEWVFCLGFPKGTIQHQYAYQVFTAPTALTKQYFDIIPNSATFIPQDGDIAVYDKTPSNVAGHIGVALGGGTVQKFLCYEQNFPIGDSPHIHERNYLSPKLLGVLRPKVSISPPLTITPQTHLPMFNNKEQQQVFAEYQAKDQKIASLTQEVQQAKANKAELVFKIKALLE